VIAGGRLDEARQMLALDYHPADRQDAERQRGFTAQLAAMIRTADSGPDQARETEKEAGEPPAGKGTTLDTTEYDRDGNAAESADHDADAAQYEHDSGSWLARDGDGQVLEVDADGHPGRAADRDDGRPVAEAAEPEAGEGAGRWDFAPPPNYREGPEGDAEHAQWEQAREAALFGTTQADQQRADRYLDARYQVERDEMEAEAG
jgi:hypothetical protein